MNPYFKELFMEILITVAIITFVSAFVSLALLTFICCNFTNFAGTTTQIVVAGVLFFLATFFGLSSYAISQATKYISRQ